MNGIKVKLQTKLGKATCQRNLEIRTQTCNYWEKVDFKKCTYVK